MLAVQLFGPRDLRVVNLHPPEKPGHGEVVIRVTATGICGSDLHSYEDARIGDTCVSSPLVLGHEFSGVIEQVGADALDGFGQPLLPGLRVAVDPAQP
ncbi:MAG: alcohol dehydrogenase catalytic domain-containing protein, partial [Verrucomicrobiae bacterium]|nr:alcohol dehydrogenase catalytic domain-containing protein [Verrucomicrobiae bacterium]